jgi:(R,R)-butanediol dehydrogenase/meso-butanediol dehydrogenase/diacetyl reductase
VRAARYHGRGDIRIEARPDPRPGPGDLLVRVSVTGICGTDAAEYVHGPHLFHIGGPHPAGGHAGPLIPGHELVGRVEAVGEDVEGFAIGELVASGAGVSCGACARCRAGRTNLCEHYWTVGLQRDGGLAELAAVPAATCAAVDPYGLPEDAASLAQPMAIAVHAVGRASPRPGEAALVLGTGGIGAFITLAAADRGSVVTAVDPDAARREVAARLGAAVVIDPVTQPDALPDGAFDAVFEVSGRAASLDRALRTVRPGGRVVVVGIQEPPSTIDLRALTLREVTLLGTLAHCVAGDLPAALALLARRAEGWADVAPVAIPLEALVEDGLLPIAHGTSPRIKTLVDPRIREARPTSTVPGIASVGS